MLMYLITVMAYKTYIYTIVYNLVLIKLTYFGHKRGWYFFKQNLHWPYYES